MSTTHYIVEASHLFRAGDKHQQQFFVLDVVSFIQDAYFSASIAKTIVLHGSTKDEQAVRYTAALERHGVQVIRMKPIASSIGKDRWYFKPAWYMYKMMGTDIPKGSNVVLIGFHNPRYITFLQRYAPEFHFSMAAFATPSKRQGLMSIPDLFKPLLVNIIDLDSRVADIKAQFRKKSSTKP